MVDAGVVEVPDIDWVEPEGVRVRGAVGYFVDDGGKGVTRVRGGEVSGAVVPERDVVEVVDSEGGGYGRGGLVDYAFGERGIGDADAGGKVRGGDGDAGGVGSEEVEVVVSRIVLVRASQPDNDEADERPDGQGHRGEDAGESTCFSHDCGVPLSIALLYFVFVFFQRQLLLDE